MRITAKTDKALIHKEIVSIETAFLKSLDQDLKLAAKRTAFYAAEYTLPITGSKGFNVVKLKQRIWNDVHRAYPSVGDTNWQGKVYKALEDMGEKKKADKFWQNHIFQGKSNEVNPRTGQLTSKKIAQGAPLATLTDEEAFAKLRVGGLKKVDESKYSTLLRTKGVVRNKTFSLPESTRPLGIVDQNRSANLAKKRQKNAGLAKAGWYQSVFALGGQRNYNASASEEGKFVWPNDMRRLSQAHQGIGSCIVRVNKNEAKISILNHLRYINHAFPKELESLVTQNATNAMKMIFDKRLAAQGRKSIAA